MTNYYTQGFIYLNSKDTNMKKNLYLPADTPHYTLGVPCDLKLWYKIIIIILLTLFLTLFVLLFSSLKCFRLDYMEWIWIFLGGFVCVLFLADFFFHTVEFQLPHFWSYDIPSAHLKKIPTVNSTLKQNKNMLNK